jgi:hypothetical protein
MRLLCCVERTGLEVKLKPCTQPVLQQSDQWLMLHKLHESTDFVISGNVAVYRQLHPTFGNIRSEMGWPPDAALHTTVP